MSGDVKILLVFTHLYRLRSLVCRPRDLKKNVVRDPHVVNSKKGHTVTVYLLLFWQKKCYGLYAPWCCWQNLENSRGTANGGNSLKRRETKLSNTVCSFCALYIWSNGWMCMHRYHPWYPTIFHISLGDLYVILFDNIIFVLYNLYY
jgi:hypothetical protein